MTIDCLHHELAQATAEPTFLFDAALPLSRTFYPLGFAVSISTNDPLVLEAAAVSWSGRTSRTAAPVVSVRIRVTEGISAGAPPAPSYRAEAHLVRITADQHNYAVCDLHRSFAFIEITRNVLRDQPYLRYHFLESVVLLLIATGHSMALHAACVSLNGKGLLLSGESGAGKSTLAYACARAGFAYTTDDACYLLLDIEVPTVVGHSHQFRFRPHARVLFPELAQQSMTPRAEGKPSVEVLTSTFPSITCLEQTQVDILLLLRRSQHGSARLVPVSTKEALRSLEEHLYPGAEIRHAQQHSLRRLNQLRAFEFHYSTLDEAVHCLRLLTETTA